jgi:hypothetical protein
MNTDTTPLKNNDDLFLEIRTAHRLLAAYYQRLLPTIEDIANAVDVNFYRWKSSEFSHPVGPASNPFMDWGWNFLPANCTRYIFHNAVNNNQVRVGELMIEFHVISDSGILLKDIPNGTRNEPDALNLPVTVNNAKSVLKVHLYAPFKAQEKNWYQSIFDPCPDPELSSKPSAQRIEDDIDCYISGFEIPLSDLMANNAVETIAARIETYKSHLLVAAQEENIKISANTVSET